MPINRDFRILLGYPNANNLKKHYKAKDIVEVNWSKIQLLNSRIKEIFHELNEVIYDNIKYENLDNFDKKIDNAYSILKNNNIIPRLNNYGRTPEDVYYNWLRGYAVCEFFSKAISIVFCIPQNSIKNVGNDKLTDIDTFSQSPTADFEIKLDDKIVRLEIQSGFTGINDIKRHKVNEAKKIFLENEIFSYIVHFDLFNGNVAIIDISSISDDNINWEHRQQFEDQIVFSIPTDAFKWALTDQPPNYKDILF